MYVYECALMLKLVHLARKQNINIHEKKKHSEMYAVSCALKHRLYGVMVSTLDSESNNPRSNLGRTYNFYC